MNECDEEYLNQDDEFKPRLDDVVNVDSKRQSRRSGHFDQNTLPKPFDAELPRILKDLKELPHHFVLSLCCHQASTSRLLFPASVTFQCLRHRVGIYGSVDKQFMKNMLTFEELKSMLNHRLVVYNVYILP